MRFSPRNTRGRNSQDSIVHNHDHRQGVRQSVDMYTEYCRYRIGGGSLDPHSCASKNHRYTTFRYKQESGTGVIAKQWWSGAILHCAVHTTED